jgi:predicted enzyme related to lactoylglutathione lyase
MSTRDTPFAPGTPCWVDLLSSDYAASKAFYSGLFGWTFDEASDQFGGYVTYSSDGFSVAGMAHNRPETGMPDFWSTYLATDDVDVTFAAATSAGASVFMPAMAVGDVGKMAMLGDTSGGAFGLWQAGTHTGFNKYNEPGSVAWDEYHSKDFKASTDFYAKVFGWNWDVTSDTDDFRYNTASVDGQTVAGMMDSASFLPAEVPSMWTVYFSVANADDSIARVLELGGEIRMAAEDTPFGRIADLIDSTGAGFKLHQELAPAMA